MRLALVIEDEPQVAGFVVGAFRHLGFEAAAVESCEHAIELIDRSGKVVVVLVHLTSDEEQLALVTTVAERWPRIKIIVMSSRPEDMTRLPPAILLSEPTSATMIMAVLKRVALETGTLRGFLH
jgi:DNA-binding response OmpR family regulator